MSSISDTVNHPSHYTNGGVECIKAIKSALTPNQYIGYLRGNIMKYLWRCELKNGIEDILKADWYLQELIHSKIAIEGDMYFCNDDCRDCPWLNVDFCRCDAMHRESPEK